MRSLNLSNLTLNSETIRLIAELYPSGIPAKLVRVENDPDTTRTSVIFSGASASKLAIIFFEDAIEPLVASELVNKAVVNGLKRSISEVLVIRCSKDTPSISLSDCSPKVVLIAGADKSFVKDCGKATVLCTESIDEVVANQESKKKFWNALRSAWEMSQK